MTHVRSLVWLLLSLLVASPSHAQVLSPPTFVIGSNGKLLPDRWRIPVNNNGNVFSVMATPPTITTNTTNYTLARAWGAYADFNVGNILSEWFSYPKTGIVTTTYPSATYGLDSVGVSFMHYGSAFEIALYETSTDFLVKVNDQYVSLTPTSTGTSGGTIQYFKYTFASAGWHRVDIIGFNISLYGVGTAATDTIMPAATRGPRTIFVGDSFSQGGSFLASVGFGEYMGWDDVASSGVSSTGYLANAGGTAPTFRQRLQHDVIALSPEVVIFFGGTNDATQTPSAVQAEALLCYQMIAAALPSTIIGVVVNTGSGVGGKTANQNAVNAAIASAATQAAGMGMNVVNINLQSLALGTPGASYTLTTTSTGVGNSTAGSSAFGMVSAANLRPVVGSTYSIGSGATLEEFQIIAIASATSTITNVTVSTPLLYNNPSSTVTLVGGSFWSGNGNSGTPSGWGNADIITSSDGLHPNRSYAGTGQIGLAIANGFLQATAPN